MRAGQKLGGLLAVLLLTSIIAPAAGGQAQEPEWNPLRAYKNIEVGEYYLKKKNYDAAISRFLEALQYKPNFALAHLRLGQAYEKKKDPQKALEHYQKYLEIVPGADDEEEVKKKIAKLSAEIERRAARSKRREPT